MKTITVPLTKEAARRLDLDICHIGDLSEYSITDKDLIILEKSGFLEKINSELKILIDDYENEKIVYSMLDKAESIVNSFYSKNYDNNIFIEINKKITLAKIKKTELHFFF